MEKYPVSMIYSGIHFSRNVKIAKGDEMNFIKERLQTISGFKEQGGFLSYEDLASHHLNG
jgi:hypothetical protein